jgi:hypothetical protein
MSCAGILLLLSPSSVPPKPDRANWESLIQHFESNALPPVGFLRVSDCRIPAVLERKRCFPDLRAVQRWLISLHQEPEGGRFTPPTAGSEFPASLWSLVDQPGVASASIAETCSFALSAREYFRDVIVVNAHEPERVVGEVAAKIGMRLECTVEEAAERVGRVLDQHRLLVAVSASSVPFPLSQQRRSSVILMPRPPASTPSTGFEARAEFRKLKADGRWPEAVLVARHARDAALADGDAHWYEEFSWELSWIDGGPAGKLRNTWTSPRQLGLDL